MSNTAPDIQAKKVSGHGICVLGLSILPLSAIFSIEF
jgi:hypothetical protein